MGSRGAGGGGRLSGGGNGPARHVGIRIMDEILLVYLFSWPVLVLLLESWRGVMVAVWLQFNIQFNSMAELSRGNRIRIILPHI